MRIVSVNHTADVYGASRCLERFAARAVRDGHELLVVLPGPGALKDALDAIGVTVRLHPLLTIIDRNTTRTLRNQLALLARFPLSVIWLMWTIAGFRADVVHTNGGVAISPAFAAKLLRRPHVWHVREFFLEFPRLWPRYERLMFVMSDAIVAVSQAIRNQFSERSRSKVWVVYDGLPAAEFERRAVEPETCAVRERFGLGQRLSACVVGRLKWKRKGQEVFIRAAGLLKSKYPDAVYLVVGTAAPGSEDHVDRLRALAHEVGVGDRVVFTGDIRDVRPVYAAVDVSVAPSVDPEPFGCIVIESMAMGTPVIGSAAAGIAEQIVGGQTGYLFAPGDEQGLAAALDALFGDEQLRHEVAAHARRRFLAAFELEESYGNYLRVFGTVRRGRTALHGSPDGAIAK
jgi:glycosyltransferase involved in cell wall biosynthesis